MPTKNSQARIDFATFLALMYVRTPAMRRICAEIIGRDLQILAYAYGSNKKAFDALNRRAEMAGARKLSAEEQERVRQAFIDLSCYRIEIGQK
jgi:hypothetical protein